MIDGKRLLELTGQDLETNFKIKSLGKRKLILKGVMQLKAHASRALNCNELSSQRSMFYQSNSFYSNPR